MKNITLILAFITLFSCNCKKTESNDLVFPKNDTESYFDFREKFSLQINENEISEFENEWYSSMLYSLKEPILKDYKGEKEIYRFTWLRTFHHPVSITVINDNNKVTITTKVLDGKGGYEPGNLIHNKKSDLSIKNFNLLIQKINKSKFWNMETESETMGNDGAQWIIEGFNKSKYKLVVRWTPLTDELIPFRAIGEFMITKSDIPKEEMNDIY